MNQLLLLGGSLAAVLILALVARLLKLGGGAIGDADAAMCAAEEMFSGFEAERAVVGSDGQAALVHGRDGSVAVLKMHGAQVAGRRLHPPVSFEDTSEGLHVATGERRFGTVLIRGVAAS